MVRKVRLAAHVRIRFIFMSLEVIIKCTTFIKPKSVPNFVNEWLIGGIFRSITTVKR